MKVSNLYIGDIQVLLQIKLKMVGYLRAKEVADTQVIGKTILYRKPGAKKVRDILSGKKYIVGVHSDFVTGKKFVNNLDNHQILKTLESNGYDKPNINKRKLLKLLDSDNTNLKGKLLK